MSRKLTLALAALGMLATVVSTTTSVEAQVAPGCFYSNNARICGNQPGLVYNGGRGTVYAVPQYAPQPMPPRGYGVENFGGQNIYYPRVYRRY